MPEVVEPLSKRHVKAARVRWEKEKRVEQECRLCGAVVPMQARQVYCSFICQRRALMLRRRERMRAS